jgi:ferredoxin
MRRLFLSISLLLLWPTSLPAQEEFPAPEFRSGYQMPQLVTSRPFSAAWAHIDIALLVVALGLAAWLVFKKRSRRGLVMLTVASLIYFGFFRKGCVCPIGAIQNVALAAGGHGYALPLVVAAFFILPLVFTLFFGRVFCSSVCPLGAIQDVVLWRPVHLPAWLDQALGLFAYVYLGLAVLLAWLNSDFLICRYDPFIGFFRLSGPAHMLFLGAVLLLISMFVGRVYCRFICPYSVLLRILSPFSKRRVSITPEECVDCRLCEKACPFGAIRYPSVPEPPRHQDAGRKQLRLALLSLPILVAVFAWIGHRSSAALSRLDFTVRLADRIWQEDNHKVEGTTDESAAFRDLAQPAQPLYQRAAEIQHRFAIGSTILGVWIALVVALKLIALIIRRRRTGYTADPANCVACARCYLSCPVEHERQEKARLVIV